MCIAVFYVYDQLLFLALCVLSLLQVGTLPAPLMPLRSMSFLSDCGKGRGRSFPTCTMSVMACTEVSTVCCTITLFLSHLSLTSQ